MTQVLRGNIVHAPKMGELSILEHGCLVLEDGVIQAVCSDLPRELEGAELRDYGDRLLMQSFVDMHLHAPQYPMLGMGMDLQLLDWLNTYTFPTEARFADTDYARRVYRRLASDLITSENRTLNRSSPTPTRQQGRMNIHNAERRHIQDLIRQNTTIGSHAENVSLGSLERLNNLGRHTISLNNRQPQLKRLSLNRRRLQLFTTPTNSIRTSNNKRNLIPSRNKRSQRRHSKIRRTHKHNTHKS